MIIFKFFILIIIIKLNLLNCTILTKKNLFFCDTNQKMNEILNFTNLKRFFIYEKLVFFIYENRILCMRHPIFNVQFNNDGGLYFIHSNIYQQEIKQDKNLLKNLSYHLGYNHDFDNNKIYELFSNDMTSHELEFDNLIGDSKFQRPIHSVIKDYYPSKTYFNEKFTVFQSDKRIFYWKHYRVKENDKFYAEVYIFFDVYWSNFLSLLAKEGKGQIDFNFGNETKFFDIYPFDVKQFIERKLFEYKNMFTFSYLSINESPLYLNLIPFGLYHQDDGFWDTTLHFKFQFKNWNIRNKVLFDDLFSCYSELSSFNQLHGIYFDQIDRKFYIFIKRYYVVIKLEEQDLVDEEFKISNNFFYKFKFNLELDDHYKSCPKTTQYEIRKIKWIKSVQNETFLSTYYECALQFTTQDNKLIFKEDKEMNSISNCHDNTLRIDNSIFCLREDTYSLFINYENRTNPIQIKSNNYLISSIFESTSVWEKDQKLKFIFNYINNQFVLMTEKNLFVLNYNNFKVESDKIKMINIKDYRKLNNYLFEFKQNDEIDELDESTESNIDTTDSIHPEKTNFVLPNIGFQKYFFICFGILILMTTLFLIFYLITKGRKRRLRLRNKRIFNNYTIRSPSKSTSRSPTRSSTAALSGQADKASKLKTKYSVTTDTSNTQTKTDPSSKSSKNISHISKTFSKTIKELSKSSRTNSKSIQKIESDKDKFNRS